MRIVIFKDRSVKIYLFLIVLFASLVGCSQNEKIEISKARLELSDLGYEYTQNDFINVVINNDLTAIRLFLKSGFKPSNSTIIYLMEFISPSTMELVISNFEKGELNERISQYSIGSNTGNHFLEIAADMNNYEMLEVFWNKGVRLPNNTFNIRRAVTIFGNNETQQFFEDKNIDFNK